MLPSSSDLARFLRIIEQQDQNASRLWVYDCSPLQQASELIVFDDSEVPENHLYAQNFESENANTSQTYQRNFPTISRELSGLAARLLTPGIPKDLRNYLNAEVEAGITHNVNKGGVAPEMSARLTDQSDSEKIVRESRYDPWIRKRTQSRMSVGN